MKKMQDLANGIESVALRPVDSDGKIFFLDAVSIPSPRRFLAAVDDANVRTFRGVADHFSDEMHERFPVRQAAWDLMSSMHAWVATTKDLSRADSAARADA